MGLAISSVNRDYFRTNRSEDRKCSICLEPFQNGQRWIAHENPESTKYRIITRSFHQSVHPMHEECYERLRESNTDQCPECRRVIGEPLREVEPIAPFPTGSPAAGPLLSDVFLATLGSSIATLASGAGAAQTLAVAGMTYACSKVAGQHAPLVSISLAATLGALSHVHFAQSAITTALAGSAIGIETLNFFQGVDHPNSTILGLGTCATMIKLWLQPGLSLGLRIGLNSAISTIISLSIVKFSDRTFNNRIF